MLLLDRRAGVLRDAQGRGFDPVARAWSASGVPPEGEPIGPRDAVRWLQDRKRLRTPIGVIGPGAATPAQIEAAEAIGGALARMDLAIVCGGRQGVMEAACRGAAAAGGLSIGLLPGTDPAEANAFVTVPIATGIGEARNALVARAAFCLAAVGSSHGTLSEVALGLQFGKRVLGIAGAAELPEVRHFETPGALVEAVARLVLGLET